MAELNDKALKVFALKYATRKTKSWRDKCMEIAKQIAEGGRAYGATNKQIENRTQEYFEMLFDIMAIPGGRIIANAGTGIKNLGNCFVLGIDDSRQSIYGTLKDAAEVFADGGGIGYNFSHIRQKGAEIKTTGGQASGPLSFMSLFDQTGEVISQASRRGAQMGVMNVSHPDIENFIHFKSHLNERNERMMHEYHRNLSIVNGGLKGTKYEKVLEKTLMDDQLTHFNVSVLLTDKFMQAVKDGKDWDLISPSTGEVVKTVNAKDLLMSMAKQAWESGDPGELFYDAINNDNMVKYLEMIEATNPCGEVPLLTDESCILASLNLKKYYDRHDEDGIDWALLKKNTKLLTRFLEDVVEVSEAPLEKINIKTKALRRLGLGIMGWADLLIDLNVPYDSDRAVELAEKVSWFINFHAWETSYELALERGSFKYYDANEADLKVVTKVLYDTKYGNSEIPLYRLICDGVRNVAVVSVAPTGSIAIIGGVNGGPEPFFALVYKRNITEGVGNIAKDSIYEINPALESTLKTNGYSKEQIFEIMECVSKTGTMAGCDMVSHEMQILFRTANEIPWKRHVDMQAAWQKYVSNAISKTINLHQTATPQDIFDVYLYMWEKGLKGGTVYRNSSKSFQILEAPKGEK
jgi:ribonucleoside-diphosphate reductase alpha chain